MDETRKCLICNEQYKPCVSFGKMPIANGFLKKEQFENEYFFELQAGCCPNCTMFQLVEQPQREMMFNENYAFYSGTSTGMTSHFKQFADTVRNNYLNTDDPFVVEIGSNDGIMLQNFLAANTKHLGIEPSMNVADVARAKGINTISSFFDEALADQILKEYGKADVILAANVMCHIPYLHSVVEGMKLLLKPDGVIMFEDPYIGDVIENTTYDQIYDEHVFLFSARSIQFLFKMHDMELIDVEPQETHGGSMRYTIARRGVRPASKRLMEQFEKENILELHKTETYDNFRQNCEKQRDRLKGLLADIRKAGKRVVGYAATSKSTTIINYCGITAEEIEYISDTTPIKHGKYSPGAHIPVKPYEEFVARHPDYALLFAYNHTKEIMAKEEQFMRSGGKWIVYVPEVKIL